MGKKWKAELKHGKTRIYLGLYLTPNSGFPVLQLRFPFFPHLGHSLESRVVIFSYSFILKHGKTRIYLGLYLTPEEAHNAYAKKAIELRGEFGRELRGVYSVVQMGHFFGFGFLISAIKPPRSCELMAEIKKPKPKKCPICTTEYTPRSSLQKVCHNYKFLRIPPLAQWLFSHRRYGPLRE
jgi:hypothetical protein